MIGIIAAVSKNGVLGDGSKLLWNYPEDLKHFRQTTAKSNIVMGRCTFESIGKPLPGRNNVIISSTLRDVAGVTVVPTIQDALSACDDCKDIWFIGGASVYEAAMQYADTILLTIIPQNIEGSDLVRFPWVNPCVFDVAEDLYTTLDNGLWVIEYNRHY